MAQLNSNPEVLLKKRKNNDLIRIEKQAAAKKRQEERLKKRASRHKNKFIRAETLVTQNLATGREKERIKRVFKNEKMVGDHYLENGSERLKFDGKPTLYFIIRVKGPTGVKIPAKVSKILNLLRLNSINTGVFIKLTDTVYPLIKLIAPYTVVGKPSLQSIRQLIQKRATITVDDKIVKLNDNNLIEEKLGDEGIICMEDIIHEILSLGENFKTVSYFLNPFELGKDVYGFTALDKLKKLEKEQESKENKHFSNSGSKPIYEIDIDEIISKQN